MFIEPTVGRELPGREIMTDGVVVKSSMQDTELLVSEIFESGLSRFPDSLVHEYRGGAHVSRTFEDVAGEVRRLAAALASLGVRQDDLVATFCWNTTEHLAAYFAVPSMGAVLHTLNLRLHDEQLVYIVGHAGDRVVIVDADLAPTLERLIDRMPTVEHVIIVGGGTFRAPDGVTVHDYRALIDAHEPDFAWPDLPEKNAAMLCYTSGTTGDPKGVAYSHRSIYLHTLMICTGSGMGFTDGDRVLPIVPMFHANAWGWPHAAWLAGSDLIMNGHYLAVEHLARIITDLAPTVAAAVPTLWTALDRYGLDHPVDYSSLRSAVVGGSSLSAALASEMSAHHGVPLIQGWGMTETSPLVTTSQPPAGTSNEDRIAWVTRSGHLVPGVRARIVDETGDELPWDGQSTGEVELAGSTIAGRYFRMDTDDPAMDGKFHDGWLRTGDAAVIHRGGWVEIRDRLKDGIKSGGEWISSVELENRLLQHPAVAEVVVVGVPDPKWEERPAACVVVREGHTVTPDDLREHLSTHFARWAVPERWEFVDELPRTSVGKLDKRSVRAQLTS